MQAFESIQFIFLGNVDFVDGTAAIWVRCTVTKQLVPNSAVSGDFLVVNCKWKYSGLPGQSNGSATPNTQVNAGSFNATGIIVLILIGAITMFLLRLRAAGGCRHNEF